MITDITGILLAGGKSKRMGEDKRFLRIGDRTLFERSLAALRAVFQNTFVVIAQGSTPIPTDVPVIHDLIPDRGSLGGVYTGLRQASTDYVFVVACDMPFLQPDVVHYMTALNRDADVVMAKREGRLQPMHAVYSRYSLPYLEEMVKARHLKIQDLVTNPSLRVRLIAEAELSLIDPEGRSFFNINSPSDLEVARTLYARSMDSRSSG